MIFRYFPDMWLLVKWFFDNKPDKPPLILIHIDMIVNSILVYATGSPMSPSNTIPIIPNIEFSWVHASKLLGQNIVEKIGIAEACSLQIHTHTPILSIIYLVLIIRKYF